MKRLATIGSVVLFLGCLCVLAAAQGVLHKDLLRIATTPWPQSAQSKVTVNPFPGGGFLLPPLAQVGKPEFKIQTLPLSVRPHLPPVPPKIPAGVYKTTPYSCIVVVPGPHPDDRCVIRPEGVASAMPIIKPELHFIPWAPAK